MVKILKQSVYIYTVFLLFGNFVSAQSPVDTLKIRSDFNTLIGNLETNYVYFNQKDVDLKCIKEYYGSEISNIKTEEQTLLFFEYLLDEFYDSHLHLQSNNNSSFRLYSPIYVELKNDKICITSYWKDQMVTALATELIDAEIVSFNGISFNRAIANFPTHCQNKRNPVVRTWIANKILAGRYNQPRALLIRTKKGELQTIDLDSIKLKEELMLLTYKTVDDIAVIRINNSLGNSQTRKEFKKALKKLKNTKGLILDLRNTIDGGNTSVANPIAGHFTRKKTQFQKYLNSKQDFVDYIKPSNPKYKKPLVILVGRWTASMGEGLASGFDGAGLGKVIGTEMYKLAGATNNYNFQNFNFGYQVPYIQVLHNSGIPRENFIPRYVVKSTNSGEDEFVKEALRLLEK